MFNQGAQLKLLAHVWLMYSKYDLNRFWGCTSISAPLT